MEDLSKDIIELIRYFVAGVLVDYNTLICNLPFLRFVFTKDDMEEIIRIVQTTEKVGEDSIVFSSNFPINDGRFMTRSRINEGINILIKTRQDYDNGVDNIFIKIPEYKEFFKLLNDLVIFFKQGRTLNCSEVNLIRGVWLRMTPSDLENVNLFLQHQIEFAVSDRVLSKFNEPIGKYLDYDIILNNSSNPPWFETNSNAKIMLRKKEQDMDQHSSDYDFMDQLFGPQPIYSYYEFPSIHYGLIIDEDKPTCFIYGIQNMSSSPLKDEQIAQALSDEKRRLRNPYVSADFIIGLKIFIDFLYEHGIQIIKVPALQVFDFVYHENLSNEAISTMDDYTKEEINNFESNPDIDKTSKAYIDYLYNKSNYYKFADKQDIISKNKTERLIHIFQLMQEFYNNIEILNDLFDQGDFLKIKINYNPKRSR